jgi:hypothetical protein
VHTSLDQSTDTLTKQKSNGAAMEQSPILQNYALSPRPKLPTAWPSQIRFPQSSAVQSRAAQAARDTATEPIIRITRTPRKSRRLPPLHLDERAPGREISAAAPALRSKRRRNAPCELPEVGRGAAQGKIGEGGRGSPETDGGGWSRGTPLTLAHCCAAQCGGCGRVQRGWREGDV